jgi:hypothetical protein
MEGAKVAERRRTSSSSLVAMRSLKKLSFASFALLFCLACVVGLAGCAPRWQVVKQASPNPMRADTKFFLDKTSFEGVRVGDKSEQEYQSGKDSEQQGSWQGDKTGFIEEFAGAYESERERVGTAKAPGEGFVIKPHVTWIEPGFYAVMARPTEVKMTVQIVDAKGTVQDEFLIQSQIPASLTNPAVGSRLRDAAKDLGRVVADYMKKRTSKD